MMFSTELLLPLVVLLPLVAALTLACVRIGKRRLAMVAVTTSGLTLAGVIVLVPDVLASGRLTWSLPALTGRFELTADAISLLFALSGAFVWFCATVYATAYLSDDTGRKRFQATSLFVLSANLGVVLAGNLPTLYVCFELLGLAALLLVIHDGSEKARKAGIKYFWMTLIGGFFLLAGILLVRAMAGSDSIEPLPPGAGSPVMLWTAFVLLLIGFGVKAGMVPLHTWLPDAHPAAPAPASALLSGVMIKTGAYGIFRMVHVIFRPEGGVESALSAWALNARLGLIVLWLGIATMLVGVILALGQHHAKRMLAWHSVSQMGFVLTGIGAGVWLGSEGAMGTAGGLLHVVNHALFKASLFLGAGVVALHAGTADMYRLGGLWRRMPVTFTCMLVAAAGITGIPLFNGFVSKCLIHHALVEGAAREGGDWLVVAEWIFLATCAGTVASFVKLIGLVFVRASRQPPPQPVRDATGPMSTAMILLTIPIIVIGLQPGIVLEGLIVPGLKTLAIPAEPVGHYLDTYYLGPSDLRSFGTVLVGGIALFAVGTRLGLFKLAAPAWFGVDIWYRRAAVTFVILCRHGGKRAAGLRVTRPQPKRIKRTRSLPGQMLTVLDERLSAIDGTRARRNTLYARLDELRDSIVRAAVDESRLRTRGQRKAESVRADRHLNATRMMAGLIATRLLERTMALTADDNADRSVSTAIEKIGTERDDFARMAADAAETWLEGGDPGKLLEAGRVDPERDAGPRPSTAANRDWWTELCEFIFRPAVRHWPATERSDDASLTRAIRALLERTTRDPSLGLGLAFLLLLALSASSILI
ncbi:MULTISPECIES: complex I subunit 5 family protein [unclassified Wenzhouxiangella]|uniref:complex I subunit 5 family protein n=1 Tax=unclassified Wenzhouxiangella TaxID=2613841 RepID=UPI0011C071C9|nr:MULTISPECIES: complex I subunit 5 family protein [unclassified Wenzhouxiangella]